MWDHVANVAARASVHMNKEAVETHRAFIASMLEGSPHQCADALTSTVEPAQGDEHLTRETSQLPRGQGAVWEHVLNVAARASAQTDVEAVEAHKAFVASLLQSAQCQGVETLTSATEPVQKDEHLPSEMCKLPEGEGAVWEHVTNVSARAPAHMNTHAVETHKAFVASLLEAEQSGRLASEIHAVPDGEGAVWEHMVNVANRATACVDVKAVETHKAFVAALLEGSACESTDAPTPESADMLAEVEEPVDDLWLIKAQPMQTCADKLRQISEVSTAAPDFLRKISCGSSAESEYEWVEA